MLILVNVTYVNKQSYCTALTHTKNHRYVNRIHRLLAITLVGTDYSKCTMLQTRTSQVIFDNFLQEKCKK